LVIHDSATYPGHVLRCKPIGVLEAVQESHGKKERNDRVFAVPTDVDVLPSDTSWLFEPTTGVHQFGGGSRAAIKQLRLPL
jgi:hypothetical protein